MLVGLEHAHELLMMLESEGGLGGIYGVNNFRQRFSERVDIFEARDKLYSFELLVGI